MKKSNTDRGEAEPVRSVHTSVLLQETIDGLDLIHHEHGVVVDGTFGGGGHSIEILKRFPHVRIIAFDQDKSAWDKAKDKFAGYEKRITFINDNFRNIGRVVNEEVDAVLLDIGLSSDQLENAKRGFSFLKDEPLLMTMKETPTDEDLTAQDIVNTWSEENIAQIIYGYGEEKFSRRIAKNIVESRKERRIETTFDLVEIIKFAVPVKYTKGKTHFATKTFQALRIAVNDELNALAEGLEGALSVMKPGGRMSVISFHSLEDRIIKNFYKKNKEGGNAVIIYKKPITAGENELRHNRRARSAKLRVLEKVEEHI
jgi:16S rRNA (cytosine1402-N4)-methyltransferase